MLISCFLFPVSCFSGLIPRTTRLVIDAPCGLVSGGGLRQASGVSSELNECPKCGSPRERAEAAGSCPSCGLLLARWEGFDRPLLDLEALRPFLTESALLTACSRHLAAHGPNRLAGVDYREVFPRR